MLFVDTHCHLNYQSFDQDLDEVVQRAVDAGVNKLIVPGLDIASSRKAVQLAEKYEPLYAGVGVYPGEIDGFAAEQVEEFYSMAIHPKVVAIGEIGLDFFHRTDNQEKQCYVFQEMLDIAANVNLPVLIHSREALVPLTSIVTQWRLQHPSLSQAGIFHAFEGGYDEALQITNLGFLLGAGGPVTYKNAKIKHEVFSKIGLHHIALETDAPFLSPQGHRGMRNEPSFIPLIAGKIADLQHCAIEDVAAVTSRNVRTLFNWDN